MNTFTDIVKELTPRLVVTFKRDGENEMFNWGILGEIPIVPLVGYIVRVQAELAFRAPEECPQSALVVAYTKLDAQKYQFNWFVHQDIPVDSLVGMLEVVKASLVTASMARAAAMQQGSQLLGPDGRPMRR